MSENLQPSSESLADHVRLQSPESDTRHQGIGMKEPSDVDWETSFPEWRDWINTFPR